MNNDNKQLKLSPTFQKILDRNPIRPDEEQEPQRTIERSPKPANDNVAFFLPGMDDFMRAMPNHIARSSLFAPVARGRRKEHKMQPLVTRGNVQILYSGEQLDEADADLCLQLIFAAAGKPLGERVYYNRAALLKAMGRPTSKQQYEWLYRRMDALFGARFIIQTPKYSLGEHGKNKWFRIIQELDYDPETQAWFYVLHRDWQKMFGGREYALIDWTKRLEIARGQDMAKAIQRLIATSADPVQRYGLEWLKDKMQYAGRLRDFKNALLRATGELERVGIIAGGRIDRSTKGNDQLVIWLPASV